MRWRASIGSAVIAAAFAALLPVPVHAQGEGSPGEIAVGQPAPAITITEYLGASADTPREMAGFVGDWLVVEFWAFWCPGCVAGIPHMNALAAELEDEGFRFITLSADPPEVLDRIFSRMPTRTLLARDAEGATAARYRIGGYPQAVVIGPDGMIRALVDPGDLTPGRLRALAAGDATAVANSYHQSQSGSEMDRTWDEKAQVDEYAPAIYSQVVLRRSPMSRRGFLRHLDTPGRILGDGIDLRELILHSYGVGDLRADYRLPEAAQRYRVSVVSIDKSHEGARRLLRSALHASFNFEARLERRATDVVVMRRLPDFGEGGIVQAEPGTEDLGIAGKTAFFLNDAPIDWIAKAMGMLLFEQPVLDETGLHGNFDVQLQWGEPIFDRIAEAFRSAGIELSRERREIDILVVEPGS